MKNEKTKKKFLAIFNYCLVPFVSIAASLYIAFWNQREEYNLMFLLPLCFMICYELLLRRSFDNFKIFSISYTIVSAIRYIVTPVLIVLGGRYDGRSATTPSVDSFILAFILMIVELFVCSFMIWVLNKRLATGKLNKKAKETNGVVFPEHWIVYLVFITITALLAAFRSSTLDAFSVIRPNENLFNYNNFGILDQIIILCLSVAKNILALMMLSFCYKKHKLSGNLFWIILSFFVILLNSSIYFGTNRFDFILSLIASTILFCMLYKHYSKIAIILMSVLGIVGFSLITQARNLHGAISNDNEFFQTADLAQMYFGGPYNVAISIETATEYPEGRNIKTAIYDCTRSIIGINVLAKNMKGVELSSTYYNRRIFGNSHSSQIIPMIGEGYYLFGVFLSPIFDIMFIFIAYYMRKSKKSINIEVGFFFIITFVRLGFINCQSATIQLNDLSFNLFLPLALAFMNGLFSSSRKAKELSDAK